MTKASSNWKWCETRRVTEVYKGEPTTKSLPAMQRSALFISSVEITTRKGTRYPLKIRTGPTPVDDYLVTGCHSDEAEPFVVRDVKWVVADTLREYRKTES